MRTTLYLTYICRPCGTSTFTYHNLFLDNLISNYAGFVCTILRSYILCGVYKELEEFMHYNKNVPMCFPA